MLTWHNALGTLLATTAVSTLATLLARRLAFRWQFVSQPRIDRWHARQIPLLGGGSMLLAMLLAFAFAFESPERYRGWLLGALIIFGVGLVDDWRNVSPWVKLIGQSTAAGCALLDGLTIHGLPLALATPITLIWIVAVTNAFNLLDNMDGLAAGVAVVSAFALFAQSWLSQEATVAVPALALAGAAMGFLFFNRHPARVFMGDCGSMMLGFSLATFAVRGASALTPNLALAISFPCFVMAVPLFDTGFVSLMRLRHGRSMAVGGRDHTSHRLVFLGLPEGRAVELLWALSAVFATLGVLAMSAQLWLLLVAALGMIAALIALGNYLGRVEVYTDDPASPDRPALIVGANDTGARALRAILDDHALNLRPVGFIADDLSTAPRSIHGLRVLGNRSVMKRCVRLLNIKELIIALPSVGAEVVEELVTFCEENGLAYREFKGGLSEARNGH